MSFLSGENVVSKGKILMHFVFYSMKWKKEVDVTHLIWKGLARWKSNLSGIRPSSSRSERSWRRQRLCRWSLFQTPSPSSNPCFISKYPHTAWINRKLNYRCWAKPFDIISVDITCRPQPCTRSCCVFGCIWVYECERQIKLQFKHR